MIISEQEQPVSDSSSVVKVMGTRLASEHETDQGREHFWVIGVNTKNIIQYIELVSLGSLTASIVHPRETFRLAVMKGVAAIILCHNHPSGDPHPSQEDLILTKRLKDAGQILGIGVLDHVIIGKTGQSFSFQEQGLFAPLYRSALSDDKEHQRQVAPATKPSPPHRKKTTTKKGESEYVDIPIVTNAEAVKRGEAVAARAQSIIGACMN